MQKMAKLFVLLALLMLPAIASAHFAGNPFLLTGRVYCDTCRCGYETYASKVLAGAAVIIQCKKNDKLTYQIEGVTDSTGSYNILVHGDRGDDVCDAMLVKSSDPECATPNRGRDRARVILTRNNGMTSDTRFANAMGFLKNEPLASCPQILQKYQEAED